MKESAELQRLEDAYGFAFPEHFLTFRQCADKLSRIGLPLDGEPLQIRLGAAFSAFREEPTHPLVDPAASSRYPLDPPEFFTVLHGPTDGLHWGLYIDDPTDPSAFLIASYYQRDGCQLSPAGSDLFEATRNQLELVSHDMKDFARDDPDNRQYYQDMLTTLDRMLEVIDSYTPEPVNASAPAIRRPTAATRTGLGIVVPPHTYRPLPGPDHFQEYDYRPDPHSVERLIDQAQTALSEGFPGTALKLGQDLWPYNEYVTISAQLLDAAYTALGRNALRRSLQAAQTLRS